MPDHAQKRVPGEPGLWVFLFGDMGIFAICFGSFLVERSKDRALFESSREALGLTIGLTNTMVLLTSSLLVVLGLGAFRAGARTIATRMFAAAMGCGLLFTLFKGIEYTHMINSGHGPSVNLYYNYYFVLTGLHLSHVIIGIGVLGFLVAKARRRDEITASRVKVIEGGACFWHLVDLLWMVLFPLLYVVV